MQAGGQRFDSAHLHHSWRDIDSDRDMQRTRRRGAPRMASVFDKVNREYPKRFDAGAIARIGRRGASGE